MSSQPWTLMWECVQLLHCWTSSTRSDDSWLSQRLRPPITTTASRWLTSRWDTIHTGSPAECGSTEVDIWTGRGRSDDLCPLWCFTLQSLFSLRCLKWDKWQAGRLLLQWWKNVTEVNKWLWQQLWKGYFLWMFSTNLSGTITSVLFLNVWPFKFSLSAKTQWVSVSKQSELVILWPVL